MEEGALRLFSVRVLWTLRNSGHPSKICLKFIQQNVTPLIALRKNFQLMNVFMKKGNKNKKLWISKALWKIYSCLLTPNCHQNHVVTYTNTDHEFLPEWQCSLISLNLSLTDDALRPMAAPIVAQSLPCFSFKDFSCSTSSEEYFPI